MVAGVNARILTVNEARFAMNLAPIEEEEEEPEPVNEVILETLVDDDE